MIKFNHSRSYSLSVNQKSIPRSSGVYAIVREDKIFKDFFICSDAYIGSSKNLRKRFNEHRSSLRGNVHHNNYLLRSYNKYTENNFLFIILYKQNKYNSQTLITKENYFLNKLGGAISRKNYNIEDPEFPGNSRSLFDKSDIKNILKDLSTGNYGLSDISKKYNCSNSTIKNIISGYNYSEVASTDDIFKAKEGLSKRQMVRGKSVGKLKGTGAVKLTQEQVDSIRSKYGVEKVVDIAAEYDIHRTTVTRIGLRQTRI